MATILILTSFGAAMGFYFPWPTLAVCSFLLIVWQIVVWTVFTEFSVVGLLLLAAYLFALQSGYLLGCYLSVARDE